MPPLDDKTASLAAAGERYSRQAALGVVGAEGQAVLARSSALVVGCGALGGFQAELLARAGVGEIVLVDRDIVELNNLQRQILFDERDADDRTPKAVAAARRLERVNSEIRVEGVVADVTRANVLDLVRRASVVLDGTDNFETRYLLNDAAVSAGVPWVYGGVLGVRGNVMAVRSGQGPCLRCILPDPPTGHALPTCETAGVLGAAVAWIAALQVTEALKLLLGGQPPDHKLFALDIWDGTIISVRAERRAECPCCGERRFEFLDGARGASQTVLCGRNAVQVTPERAGDVDLERLRARLAPLGAVSRGGMVLEFQVEERRLIVFPDGRVLVMGTTEPAEARGLVAKYLGM